MQRKIQTPEWVRGRTIYEVNLRQYTKDGTLKAFEAHLPRLKELGVGILWFMPIQPIGKKNRKGTLGSYYSISSYSAVNPEFGTLNDFKSLVQKIHDLGMKVIIDWVANHTAWDHHWTIDHPEYYEKDKNGEFKAPIEDWEDVIHLNYRNPNLWDAMTREMAFWLKEADIDGFRCDMAHLVLTPFWSRARRELDKIKPIFMLAESENYDLLEYAFDAIYNWKLMHALNDIASGKIKADKVGEIIINQINYLPKDALLLNFTSNHDENSWKGSAIERIHYYLEPLTVLTFLVPGIPLIYSGQEAGNYRRLKFFDKDVIDWKDDKMFGLYQKLVTLQKNTSNPASEMKFSIIQNDHPKDILSFENRLGNVRSLIFLNLSDKDQKFNIKCKDYDGQYLDLISNENVLFSCQNQIKLKQYRFMVLRKNN